MGVMDRLKIFVVKEPVVAASCLIAGFGEPYVTYSLSMGMFGCYPRSGSLTQACMSAAGFRNRTPDEAACLRRVSHGLFLPAVVRPILDSWETAEKVPPPPLNDVVAGVTGKKN